MALILHLLRTSSQQEDAGGVDCTVLYGEMYFSSAETLYRAGLYRAGLYSTTPVKVRTLFSILKKAFILFLLTLFFFCCPLPGNAIGS